MRSQASKSSPKKGVVKPALKVKPPLKKTVTPKKKTLVNKSLTKGSKKNVTKDDATSKSEGDAAGDKNEITLENLKAGPSKLSITSDLVAKKSKKETKDKKEPVKNGNGNAKNLISKKPINAKNKNSPNKRIEKNEELKNKVSKNVMKKTAKFSKAKTIVKKGKSNSGNLKQSKLAQAKDNPEIEVKEDNTSTNSKITTNEENEISKQTEEIENLSRNAEKKKEPKNESEERSPTQSPSSSTSSNKNDKTTPTKISASNKSETPKTETERPPKFFTSSRSPRMVDIDVKCLKNSKGNLSVSERFLSMKCESKSDCNNKDKSAQNTLVSQGPEIDVYTFTEKVDSPKSVLSEFRSSSNKNVGRVRPIARVKGTIVDKTTESEKKKYSPHRPIEEVVQQLKASICTDEANSNQNNFDLINKSSDARDADDTPKAIVSKSYKMVARKSSVTGKPFSPIKFPDQEPSLNIEENVNIQSNSPNKKTPMKLKKEQKSSSSDDEFDTSKFSLNTKSFHYSSSDESLNDSNDEAKESSGSDASKNKKTKNKRYRKIMDSAKKNTSKELKELSKDSLVDLKEEDILLLGTEKPSKRRRKLLSMWNGPKKHRMASLNAIAKVHCLYENESRTHMELGLMRTVERAPIPSTSKQPVVSKKKETKPKESEKHETTSESEYESKQERKDDSSESSDDSPPQRTLRGVPGIRSAGKYWDPKSCTSSSEESEQESKKKNNPVIKKIVKASTSSSKSDSDKPPAKMKKTAGVPIKKKRNRSEVVMDLKDMVVQKRMASLNATAILAASYEKRSPKSSKDDTTSDSCSDESFSQNSKNGVSSGVKSETKIEEPKKEKDVDEPILTDRKQKVEVIVNQDTDVTITGVYSTHHHEGYCTVAGMQYRISSTSLTQTTATANCEKEGCTKDDGARYTPLTALSSMQPPAEHAHSHPHPVAELGGLSRRAGCSSAFSAPSPSAHHDPGNNTISFEVLQKTLTIGYYQPAGPLIKEGSADERALARYHMPHHHPPHPPVLPQYGPYYPDFCYGRYYRPPGQYHIPPPQGDGPMGGLGSEPYPPPQYYGTPPPCYQHSPQRIPYVEYRGCPCPLNACPKNVLIGPATGKAPAGGGPDVPSALATPGGAFRAKVRACALDAVADTHGSGKDPPMEPEPPAAADAPHPCPLPAIGSASPKREIFDVRDLRIASDVRAVEAVGPLSPARGSDGACVPQPPSSAPRRARVGKAMARRSLVGDDTNFLLTVTQPAPLQSQHSDADDDVMAISPPLSVPIDLSSSDERSTPLVDIKKENEGPTFAAARKPEAQALKEHNSTRTDGAIVNDNNKPVKRRYSRTKLEIDMKDTQLEEGCKTNGIGEHVKLIKRRKVSGDQTEPPKIEIVAKETKKKPSQPKKTPKSPPAEKKPTKRKLENSVSSPRAKKILLETSSDENPRVGSGALVLNDAPAIKDKEEMSTQKPKTKSALLLDNLIRKNSIDRAPEKEPNPAELFLSPIENCTKKMLNINNNVVENANTVSGVRPDTIAAVHQLIGKKMAFKNACKMDKVDSKVTNNVKSVLKTPTTKTTLKESRKTVNKNEIKEDIKHKGSLEKVTSEPVTVKVDEKQEEMKDESLDKLSEESDDDRFLIEDPLKLTPVKSSSKDDVSVPTESSKESQKVEPERTLEVEIKESTKSKRCKLTSEIKAKNVEKVIKLLVSKRPVIKTDEATLVVEEACASPVPFSGTRKNKRRGSKRGRRKPTIADLPTLELRAPPRWSNGWSWDGDHYLAKVYLNNDSKLDRLARCWPRMTHASGDKVARGDCVLLRASVARAQPFVARVASLWENQDDGEMMVSLVWYYRPEHTHSGRLPEDAPDEVFASRHRDANSVACIEDKCYVLTFNEYCRYRKRLKAAEEGVTITPTIVPPLPASDMNPMFAPNDSKLPPSVSPELVLFCRKVYDFRSKKIHVPNK